ncbi:MAG: type VI secretion system tip protein VgrG [Methyloprofundus sp.]|nr:type VI secretion system tip protein VgrG [Methyloprofundus sp.]
MAATQENREIEIITPLGTDVLLLMDLNITEELGRLFTINVEVASEENISFEDLLGENVSIRLNLPEGKRFFNGHVTNISQSVDEGEYARYQLTIQPWLWFLTRTADCRIFQNKTVPEIIKEVCSDLGFTDIDDKLTATYRQWEYCVQYRETAFHFLSRLMEQEGIYYFFTHEQGKHTLNLADAFGSHSPISGYEEISYYPPDSTVNREDDKCITNWFLSKQIQPGNYALNDYDFARPKADLKASSTVSRSHSEDAHEIFDYPGEYVESNDGDDYARKRIEELQWQYEQAQGQGRARGLMTGGLFTLKKYPRDDQNRQYLVIFVNHHVRLDSYEANGGSGAVYSNAFTAIESNTAYRSPRITPKPIVQGPQTALVVGPSGDEIYTNEHGQVTLQFHWDRYGEKDENSSCWVRVSQLWAGKTWGGIHIPRIGQEVIVEFLEGDPDRPIITGRVYNGDQTPPYTLPANKTQSGIKSRSSKDGTNANFNEIRFEDKKGEEELYIHAEKDRTQIVENDDSLKVGFDKKDSGDQTIDIYNDRTVTIDQGTDTLLIKTGDRIVTVNSGDRTTTIKSGDDTLKVNLGDHLVTIGAGKQVTKAMTSIELKVGANSIKLTQSGITIKGMMIKIQGSTMAEMKSPMTTVKGDALLTLKGGVTMIN